MGKERPKQPYSAPESYLTTREAAIKLGVSLRTIQLWVENGTLTAWKTAGGHRRIPHNAVDEILGQRKFALKHNPSGESFTLIIVAANQHLRESFEQQIRLWNMPIHLITVSNGFDGLLEIGRCAPDLIISTLELPDMDGFQMIKSVSEKPELGHTQIVIISELRPEEIAAKGKLPGTVTVYPGAVDFSLLGKRVRKLVRRDPPIIS